MTNLNLEIEEDILKAIELGKPPEYIITYFKKANTDFFNDKLTLPYFIWNADLSNDPNNLIDAHGYFCDTKLGPLIIFKHRARFVNGKIMRMDTLPVLYQQYDLLHEMIHYFLWNEKLKDPTLFRQHGELFTYHANRIGKKLGLTPVIIKPGRPKSAEFWPSYDIGKNYFDAQKIVKEIKW